VQTSRGYVLFRRGVLIVRNQDEFEQLDQLFASYPDGMFWTRDVPRDLKGMFDGSSVWSKMGFVAVSGVQDSPDYAANTFVLFPLWPILLAVGLPTAVMVRKKCKAVRRARRQRRGLCPGCGYDVSHSESTRCPECGDPVSVRTDA
jgi:hypothetical protein